MYIYIYIYIYPRDMSAGYLIYIIAEMQGVGEDALSMAGLLQGCASTCIRTMGFGLPLVSL